MCTCFEGNSWIQSSIVNTKISVVIRGHRFGTQSERHNNTAAPTTAGNFLKAHYGPTIAHYSCLQQLLLELCETKMCPKGNVEEQCVKWRQEFLQVRLWTVIPLQKTLKIHYGSTLFYLSPVPTYILYTYYSSHKNWVINRY